MSSWGKEEHLGTTCLKPLAGNTPRQLRLQCRPHRPCVASVASLDVMDRRAEHTVDNEVGEISSPHSGGFSRPTGHLLLFSNTDTTTTFVFYLLECWSGIKNVSMLLTDNCAAITPTHSPTLLHGYLWSILIPLSPLSCPPGFVWKNQDMGEGTEVLPSTAGL